MRRQLRGLLICGLGTFSVPAFKLDQADSQLNAERFWQSPRRAAQDVLGRVVVPVRGYQRRQRNVVGFLTRIQFRRPLVFQEGPLSIRDMLVALPKQVMVVCVLLLAGAERDKKLQGLLRNAATQTQR